MHTTINYGQLINEINRCYIKILELGEKKTLFQMTKFYYYVHPHGGSADTAQNEKLIYWVHVGDYDEWATSD